MPVVRGGGQEVTPGLMTLKRHEQRERNTVTSFYWKHTQTQRPALRQLNSYWYVRERERARQMHGQRKHWATGLLFWPIRLVLGTKKRRKIEDMKCVGFSLCSEVLLTAERQTGPVESSQQGQRISIESMTIHLHGEHPGYKEGGGGESCYLRLFINDGLGPLIFCKAL